MQLGFLTRTPRGRCVTRKAYEHLGLSVPASLADEAEQFRFCAPEFYTIGDCVTPATIYQATSQAFYAARDIGRL